MWGWGGGTYNVDQNIQRLPRPLLHQLRRVVLCPLGLLFLAKVAAERFLTPWTIARVGDRREGGHGFVFARVF